MWTGFWFSALCVLIVGTVTRLHHQFSGPCQRVWFTNKKFYIIRTMGIKYQYTIPFIELLYENFTYIGDYTFFKSLFCSIIPSLWIKDHTDNLSETDPTPWDGFTNKKSGRFVGSFTVGTAMTYFMDCVGVSFQIAFRSVRHPGFDVE